MQKNTKNQVFQHKQHINHIKEYNKSWDFYKGLTVNQIEQAIRKDTIWDRPSWPLKGKPSKIMDQINELLNNDNNFFKFADPSATSNQPQKLFRFCFFKKRGKHDQNNKSLYLRTPKELDAHTCVLMVLISTSNPENTSF